MIKSPISQVAKCCTKIWGVLQKKFSPNNKRILLSLEFFLINFLGSACSPSVLLDTAFRPTPWDWSRSYNVHIDCA
jgi:hypothetical protein